MAQNKKFVTSSENQNENYIQRYESGIQYRANK